MPYLSDAFVSTYLEKEVPFGGNGYGEFIYLRTYSRWLQNEQRREYWPETVRRAVEYSISLYQGPASQEELQKEAEELFDGIFHLRLFPAGRTLWAGGTPASSQFPLSNFNCAGCVVDNYTAFTDTFYLLLVGAGVGFRILDNDVAKLAPVNSKIHLSNKPFHAKNPSERIEHSMKFEDDGSVYIVVGDSKEGWVESLGFYLEAIQRHDVEAIIINYDSVRPNGEILKTFGGRASGFEALRTMFKQLSKIVSSSNGNLSPINVLDMMNIIALSVVSGGVRRSSQIALFSHGNKEVASAKTGDWIQQTPWRSMSNNSIFFLSKPSEEELLSIFKTISENGEPGFVNANAASVRRQNFGVINPCAEILLSGGNGAGGGGLCNLTSVNMSAFVRDNSLDVPGLSKAVKLATRIALRQTNSDLELPIWDAIQKRDRLTGVSLSGVNDACDAMSYDNEDLESLLNKLNIVANQEADKYAYEMRIPRPLLVTTVKPEGSISQMPVISQGVHRSCAPYYVRRVRITATDPLARVMRDLGYPTYPDGCDDTKGFEEAPIYERLNALQQSYTWVVEFPVKTISKMRRVDESATDQFNRYLTFQKNWTDHNTSITISFKPSEVVPLVGQILKSWDDYIAISFLPDFTIMDENPYALMPEEPITEEEYWRRVDSLKDVNRGDVRRLLTQYESEDLSALPLDDNCSTGVCPIR